ESRPEPRAPEPKPVEVRPPEIRAPASRPPERPSEPRLPEPRGTDPRPAPAADATLDVSASAIERLRSSLQGNERPRTDMPTTDGVAPAEEVPLSPNGANGAHPPAAPAPPTAKATNGAAHPDAAAEAKGPRLDFLFRSKSSRTAQAESFDALWPKRPA